MKTCVYTRLSSGSSRSKLFHYCATTVAFSSIVLLKLVPSCSQRIMARQRKSLKLKARPSLYFCYLPSQIRLPRGPWKRHHPSLVHWANINVLHGRLLQAVGLASEFISTPHQHSQFLPTNRTVRSKACHAGTLSELKWSVIASRSWYV